jgi:hypothetical protein
MPISAAERKEFRKALNTLLECAESVRCNHLHHPTKDQHDSDEVCWVEYRIARAAFVVNKYLRDIGIL